MKRVLLLGVIFIASIGQIMGQKHEPWDIFFTPKAGAAYTGFSSLNCEYKPGFVGGTGIEVFFSPHFSFETALTFSMEGANKVDNDLNQRDSNYNLNYINMDYLFKWYIGNHMNIFTGLHMGRLVWAKANGVDISDELNKGAITIPAGIGIDIGRLAISAQFNYSFPKIAKSDRAKQILKDASLMGGFVTIGYKIQVF
ncbi:MAG: outer membrane beta-barrel protein [Prevotella sp.]|nr:outer membrane beta-barrel protein [Prevotella sp.]MDY4039299.1 outer membrane beta-barrel protein [Prevotella sp.]